MTEAQVTIVVVPRERFSHTRESLESIYEHTEFPFTLVYVDGGSPHKTKCYLENQARARGFQLIRTEHYLPPNHARNMGLQKVNTKYVVFIDNDVVVSPGWLSRLVECAEETGAWVISPLVCVGKPEEQIIHCAGGEAHIVVASTGTKSGRRIHEKMYGAGQRLIDVREQLQRQQTELAEFHCMFVRSDVFEQVGFFDEAMLNTREHIDFCMTVAQAGGTVYLEPTSVVTYVQKTELELADIPYYLLRWSDAWALASMERLRDKWGLIESKSPGTRSSVEWRRKKTVIKPILNKLTLIRKSRRVQNFLYSLDSMLNDYITNQYARKHLQHMQDQTTTYER